MECWSDGVLECWSSGGVVAMVAIVCGSNGAVKRKFWHHLQFVPSRLKSRLPPLAEGIPTGQEGIILVATEWRKNLAHSVSYGKRRKMFIEPQSGERNFPARYKLNEKRAVDERALGMRSGGAAFQAPVLRRAFRRNTGAKRSPQQPDPVR